MSTDNLFRILLPVVILGFAAHRGYYVKIHSQPDAATLKEREPDLISRLAGILGLAGFLAGAAFVVNPGWLAFAHLAFPGWLRWLGLSVALAGFALLQWSQVTLGRNWSDVPRLLEAQSLITSGPYRSIRHPIYTAFLLILGSTLLISANWLVGLSWIGMTVLEVLSRVRFEEGLMLEYFGEPYRRYMRQTGRFLPRLGAGRAE